LFLPGIIRSYLRIRRLWAHKSSTEDKD
jgi:hypothetical protein